VSRFFGPRVGIEEDPVTGSAHTTLTPYWAAPREDAAVAMKLRDAWVAELPYRRRPREIAGKAVPFLREIVV
jgi:predicted PhzF superfamily epimerase YddE/YHI9